MIAVLVGNAQYVSARYLRVYRGRSSVLSRLGRGCGVEPVRGQGPPVFGKCARECFSLGGPLSHPADIICFYLRPNTPAPHFTLQSNQRQRSLLQLWTASMKKQ
jgi:hypothetical protein